jgi:hypothetical protein
MFPYVNEELYPDANGKTTGFAISMNYSGVQSKCTIFLYYFLTV